METNLMPQKLFPLVKMVEKHRSVPIYKSSPPVLASYQDYSSLSYLASTKTVSNLLLPAKTGVCGK